MNWWDRISTIRFHRFQTKIKKNLKPHFVKFLGYIQPKPNPIFARHKLNNEEQGSNTFDQFVKKLKLLPRNCNCKVTNEMIRDRTVFGHSEKIQEKPINVERLRGAHT